MRKMIFYLLFILLLVFAIWSVAKGVNTSAISINSFSTILEEDDKLEDLIKEASKQKNESYKSALEELQAALKKLKTSEESYQQLLDLGVDDNGVPLSKIQEYEMEKIWITVGNYAKKQGVDLKIDVTVNNSVAGTYDLNFTVVGKYVQIADFLYDIQRDKTLVFKIEDFKLIPAVETTDVAVQQTTTENGESQVQQTEVFDLSASFVCKDIKLNIVEPEVEGTEEGSETGAEDENKQAEQSTETTTSNT